MELVGKYREDLYICAQCSFCTTTCETIGYTLWESNTPKGRMFALKELLEGNLEGKSSIMEELSTSAFNCTLCGRCEAVCQTDIKLRDLWLNLRTELVDRGHFPQKLSLMRDGINDTGNVANYPNNERASWVDFVEDAPDHLFQNEKADVVYFVGCMSSFSPAISSIPESFAQVLHKAGVDFTILGEKEMCCTYPLLVGGLGGDKELTDRLRKANVDAVKATGAKEMVFTCPSCYLTWKEEYIEQYGLDVELYHSTHYIRDLARDGKIKLNKTDTKVCYHDPCDLGRNSKEYEAPRKIISYTGAQLAEPDQTKEIAYCCGGGGVVEVYDPDLSTYMSSAAVRAFDETGAEITLTACQQCKRTFQSTAKAINSSMKYMDIVEFVLEHME
ncbi:MAG: (Fe-S)-binding protein [Candidatus Desulfatibia sp.]|uniref:(Fe-S)-binding protein n=1 Tax=Candidatus Desulfatibia sp. TaxID=3101189 RepID=UPI002F326348